MSLDREMMTFRQRLPGLLAAGDGGRFALVLGDQLIGVWDTEEEALEIGYEKSLFKPFLVKKIAERDEPLYFSRNITQCL